MKIKVPKIKPVKLFYFLISLFLTYMLTQQAVLKFDGSLYAVYLIFNIGMILCLRYIWNRRKNFLFEFFLLSVVLISLVRYTVYKDTNEFLEYMTLTVLLFLLQNTKEEYKKIFLLASACALLPDVLRTILTIFANRTFPGNRVGIMTALFLGLTICILANKKAVKYVIMAFGLLLLTFIQSRTCVMAFAAACMISISIDLKGKLTKRKLLFTVILGLAAVWFIYAAADLMMNLLYNKWGNNSMDSWGTRVVFWTDIFEHNTIIGLNPNYMMDKYGVSNCHNTFIQAYLQFGWFVFFLHSIWYIRLLISEVKVGKTETNPWLSYVVLYSLLSVGECVFMYDNTYTLYPIVLVASAGFICGIPAAMRSNL